MIRLSCSSLSCDGFADNDFASTFETLPQVGIRYVEFNCWHPTTLTPSYIRTLKRRCEISGLIPVSVYSSGLGGDPLKDIGHKLRMIDACCELGCRRIVMTGGAREGRFIGDALIVLQEIVPYAEAKDVLICLENHVDNSLENLDDYHAVFSAIDSSHLGLCLDTGHFEAAGVSCSEVIDHFHKRINHIHLKENKGFGSKNFTRFGEGDTDNYGLVKRMKSLHYSGYIDIELSPEILEKNAGVLDRKDIATPVSMFRDLEEK